MNVLLQQHGCSLFAAESLNCYVQDGPHEPATKMDCQMHNACRKVTDSKSKPSCILVLCLLFYMKSALVAKLRVVVHNVNDLTDAFQALFCSTQSINNTLDSHCVRLL